jgi:hypothetical protein
MLPSGRIHRPQRRLVCGTGPLIAIAERLGVTRPASIDHHHMPAVKSDHCDGFELLPV